MLSAPGARLELLERDVPAPGPGARFPIVLGHEITGVVPALGPGVEFPVVGSRVGAQFLYASCGHCDYCVRGD